MAVIIPLTLNGPRGCHYSPDPQRPPWLSLFPCSVSHPSAQSSSPDNSSPLLCRRPSDLLSPPPVTRTILAAYQMLLSVYSCVYLVTAIVLPRLQRFKVFETKNRNATIREQNEQTQQNVTNYKSNNTSVTNPSLTCTTITTPTTQHASKIAQCVRFYLFFSLSLFSRMLQNSNEGCSSNIRSA